MAVFEVVMKQRVSGGRELANVLSMRETTGMSAQDVGEVARSSWVNNVMTLQAATLILETVSVREIDGVKYADVVSGAAGTFGSTGQGAPPQVSLLAKKITPALPRRRWGRIFLAGITEGSIDAAGYMASTTLSSWQTKLNNYMTALAAGGLTMVQLTSPTPLFTGGTVEGGSFGGGQFQWVPVQSLTAMPLVATQQRRLRD